MRIALALTLAILAAGCLEPGDTPAPGVAPTGTPTTTPPGLNTTGEPVAFRTLLHQVNVELFESPVQRALSQEEFDAVWSTYAASIEPRPAQPDVDPSRERIVAVATGQFGAGCHDVRVTSVMREAGGDVLVAYDVYDGEGPARICTAQVVWPTHIVAIEDADGPLRFAPHATEVHPDAERETFEARTLDIGSFSGIHNDTRAFVRERAAWEALWSEHRPGTQAPVVEWGNESVIAVVESGPTGCFGIHIGNVTYAGGGFVVEVVHEPTPPGFACIQALEDAYHFAAVPDRPGPVRFTETRTADDMPGTAPTAPAQPTTPPAASDFEFRTLDQGGASGIRDERREVIRNESAWAAFWSAHGEGRMPPPERPRVDLAKEHVLVATAGDRSNTCWGIEVTRIVVDEDEVRAHVRTRAPPMGAICGQAITQPYHYVTYPATEKPLRVVEERA